jgi:Protein of unknown function (DUF3185)
VYVESPTQMKTYMKNQKLIGVALLVAGAIALYFGWQSSESVGDQVTEAFTGRFTDETMVFIIGGAVALVAGVFLMLRK